MRIPCGSRRNGRVRVAQKIRVTAVDRGCGCDRAREALLKEQFAARTIRRRIHQLLPKFMVREKNLTAQVPWAPPTGLQLLPPQEDFIAGWKLDRAVCPVSAPTGGSRQAPRILREFVRLRLADYPEA